MSEKTPREAQRAALAIGLEHYKDDPRMQPLLVLAEALAQPEPEPVGKKLTQEEQLRIDGKCGPFLWWRPVPDGSLLYAAPPPPATPELRQGEIPAHKMSRQSSQPAGPCDPGQQAAQPALIDALISRLANCRAMAADRGVPSVDLQSIDDAIRALRSQP